MAGRIERIVLRRFRGATTTTELALDAKKPIALIFGENGAGKSTIVDAIDAVCNKSAGSLVGRSSTDLRKHLPSAGSTAADLSVELTAGGQTWRASVGGRAGINVNGNAPAPTFVHILRRSQLLRLIEAAPAERYEALRKFIDVGRVEDGEQALRAAERASAKRLETAINGKHEADTALVQLWLAEGRPVAGDGTAGGWAAVKAAADMTATRARLNVIGAALTRMDEAVGARDRLESAHQAVARERERVTQVEQEAAAVIAATGGEADIALARLLQNVRSFLEPRSPDACPVCEQPVAAETLRNRLDERLASMTALTSAGGRMATVSHDLEGAVAVERRCAQELTDAVHACIKAVAQIAAGDAPATPHTMPSSDHTIETPAEAEALVTRMIGNREPLLSRRDSLQADINQHNAIVLHEERARAFDQQVEDEYALHERFERAVRVVHSQRIAYVQGVIDSVAEECARLYERIHPGEPVGLVGFRLDEKTRGSLHQVARFHEFIDVPPQAYFSESHLDTLGFCLFLAVAKLHSGKDAVIVLDDVFTSVDATHLTRIVDLLTEECDHLRQIIITTHSRPWLDRYRLGQVPAAKSGIIELHRWSPERGIRHYRGKLTLETLADLLDSEPFDRQVVASVAGVLLETLFDHLTLLYECTMPRRRHGDYTLGQLLDGASKLCAKLTISYPAPGATAPNEVKIGPLFDAVRSLVFIRNQVGAHFNAAGSGIADNDVEDFGRRTLALADALICQGCGGMARSEKENGWNCECKTMCMTPLKL